MSVSGDNNMLSPFRLGRPIPDLVFVEFGHSSRSIKVFVLRHVKWSVTGFVFRQLIAKKKYIIGKSSSEERLKLEIKLLKMA